MPHSAKSPDAMRLQRFLAECGVASRRASEELISAGRVTVNGEVATLGQSVNVVEDVVAVDGNTVEPEREKALFGENAVQYTAALRLLGNHIQGLMTAIRGE